MEYTAPARPPSSSRPILTRSEAEEYDKDSQASGILIHSK
jgi:hypothetical protein